MPSMVSTVNFGASNASLSTVGYRILNPDLTVQTARTTSGVSEVIAATGVYRATINYPIKFTGIVLWDTGEATPNYASESINPIDADSMADEVRTMLRSLNTSLSSHLERLLKGRKPKDTQEDFDKVIRAISDLKEKMNGVLPHISSEIGKIDFSPEIKPVVNVDMAQMIECVKGINGHISGTNDEILKTLIERNEAVKTMLLATKNSLTEMIRPTAEEYRGIVNHLKSLTGDFRKSSSNVFSEVRNMDMKYESNFNKKIKFIEAVLNKAVDEMLGEIVKSVTQVTEKLSQKSKAQELLETILESIGEGIQNGKFSPKNRFTREQMQTLIALRG